MSISNDVSTLERWRSQDLATSLFSSRNALAFAAITIFSIVWQMRWGTIPDTSWLITACERMLSGERLYSQIYETNPPFSVWLYWPPVAAARMLGIAPEILVQAWTYLAALAGLLFSGAIIKRAGFPETASLFKLAPAFYAMLVIFPGNAFSEREHIGVAFFIPLLVLHAWRARENATPPSLGLAALAGLSGSMLLLVKPYYAIMVLVPALLVAVRRRSLKPIFAPEHWVIGGVCIAYLGAVKLIYPEFLHNVYPLLADVYAQIGVFQPILARYGFAWCFLLFSAFRLWPAGRFPELTAVGLAASVAGMFPLFYQAKGWAYHAYPTIFCAIAAIFCLLAYLRSERHSENLLSLVPGTTRALMLAGVVVAFCPYWSSQKPDSTLVATIHTATDQPTVALIGSDIAAGHPLNRMIGGRFVSTHVSDWLGAYSLYLSKLAELSGNAAEATHYNTIMVRYAEGKREEFERRRPDVIVFQKDDMYWTNRLRKRFGFDAILAHYRVLAEDDIVRIYLRDDYIRPQPLTDDLVTLLSSPAAVSD